MRVQRRELTGLSKAQYSIFVTFLKTAYTHTIALNLRSPATLLALRTQLRAGSF
jgi:hypothetical protein